MPTARSFKNSFWPCFSRKFPIINHPNRRISDNDNRRNDERIPERMQSRMTVSPKSMNAAIVRKQKIIGLFPRGIQRSGFFSKDNAVFFYKIFKLNKKMFIVCQIAEKRKPHRLPSAFDKKNYLNKKCYYSQSTQFSEKPFLLSRHVLRTVKISFVAHGIRKRH